MKNCLVLAVVIASVTSAFAQMPDAVWTGQAQCQLSLQSPNYVYQEIQTWAITGPPQIQGALGIYPATWSVIGQGQRQDVQGPQTTTMRWSTSVPPQAAPLAIFVNSANQLIIKSYHAQLRVNGAVTGSRQAVLSGSAQNPTAVTFAEFEYQFPAIEYAATSTNVAGTSSTPLNGGIGPMQPAGIPGAAVCQWQFTKGASSSTGPAPISGTTNTPVASKLKSAGGLTVTSPGVLPPAAPPLPGSESSSAAAASSSAESAASKEPVQTLQATSQPISNLSTLLKPPSAPTGFTATYLGNGTVQLKWQVVSGAQQYRLTGPGLPSSGFSVQGTSNDVAVQQVPPGLDQWQIVSIGLNNSSDPNQTAKISLIIRYPPAHSPAWLSKANGAGNPALTLTHYLSLCNQCLPGANFKDVMQSLGLRIDTIAVFPDAGSGCGTTPWCGGEGMPWVDEQAARYTNVTEFENSTRVTGCWTIGQPNGRIVCYTKTSDHGLQVIVKQTDYSWFLSFSGDPNAEVFDWVNYDSGQLDRIPPGQRFNSGYTLTNSVTFDSEGAKFPPHTCLACHGGTFTASGVTGSTLLPLDPGLIKPATFTIAGNNYSYDAGNVRKVNQAVITVSPSAAVARYLTGLYGIDPRATSSAGDPNYVPQGWKQQPEVYNNVLKPYCMMCHLATPSNLDFTIPGNFYQNKDLVYTTVCSAHSMPHAEAPFKQLWSKDTGPVFMPGFMAGVLGYQSCP